MSPVTQHPAWGLRPFLRPEGPNASQTSLARGLSALHVSLHTHWHPGHLCEPKTPELMGIMGSPNKQGCRQQGTL